MPLNNNEDKEIHSDAERWVSNDERKYLHLGKPRRTAPFIHRRDGIRYQVCKLDPEGGRYVRLDVCSCAALQVRHVRNVLLSSAIVLLCACASKLAQL